RENERRKRAYDAELSIWRREDVELRKMIAAAETFQGLPASRVTIPISLRPDEAVLWTAPAVHLVEVQSKPTLLHRPGYAQFSLRELRGPFTGALPTGARVVDGGPAAVTNQRVIFQGRRHGREWEYGRLLGVTHEREAPL